LTTSLTTLSVVMTSAHDRSKARSLMGWTPGLRTLVSGRVLPCGCVAGVYETWARSLVTILDERDASCQNPGHAVHEVLAIAAPD
jgi:hypothetical protein